MHTELKKFTSLSLFSAALIAASSMANAVAIGTYNLSNHPDGNANPPPYGLRLDGLITGNQNDIYTFDFDHIDSAMTMVYDGSTITISGQAYGGQDIGGSYLAGTTDVWTINFVYNVGVSQPGDGGLDDVKVLADHQNYGSISSGLGSYEIADKAQNGLSFQLGDENGGGHRGFDGISGWGWLKTGDDCLGGTECENLPYSDWLFTATPVPVPAAAWLFGSALVGLASIGRSRKH